MTLSSLYRFTFRFGLKGEKNPLLRMKRALSIIQWCQLAVFPKLVSDAKCCTWSWSSFSRKQQSERMVCLWLFSLLLQSRECTAPPSNSTGVQTFTLYVTISSYSHSGVSFKKKMCKCMLGNQQRILTWLNVGFTCTLPICLCLFFVSRVQIQGMFHGANWLWVFSQAIALISHIGTDFGSVEGRTQPS